MKSHADLERMINDVFAEWNPIGVPDTIARDEYRSYVNEVIALGSNVEEIIRYLEELLSKTMGFNYDRRNPEHRSSIEAIANKMAQVLKTP